MKNKLLFLSIILIAFSNLTAQVSINADGSSPDVSAMLDVKSTDKGILIPRLTLTEINAITNHSNSLTVFNTSDDKFYTYILADNEWKEIAYGTGTIAGPFSCGDDFVDSRDGKSYATVQIGTQCWMAENLNVGTMINRSSDQTDNATIEKYCYDNSTTNCDTYGGLYQWNEMMDYVTTEITQGICPDGWHLPSDAEWTDLTDYLGELAVAGGKMKETGTTHWIAPNTGATNESGFTALPGGYSNNVSFTNLGSYGYFWSATEDNVLNAWGRNLVTGGSNVARLFYTKSIGFSVRCLED